MNVTNGIVNIVHLTILVHNLFLIQQQHYETKFLNKLKLKIKQQTKKQLQQAKILQNKKMQQEFQACATKYSEAMELDVKPSPEDHPYDNKYASRKLLVC